MIKFICMFNINTPQRIFWLLFGVNLFNYIDRQILYSVFPLLQNELGFTDTQLGTLASAFMIVYMLYAPIAGYFADRGPRQRMMSISVVVWSLATMGGALVNNFKTMLLSRSLIGVGEGGFTSIAQGYLSDMFPKERRARILAAFGLGMPIGSALGYLLGGWVGESFGWRAAFMLVGAPGVVLGLLILGLKDEKRNYIRQHLEAAPKMSAYLTLLQNKRFLFICLGQAMVIFLTGAMAAWLPTYFHRFYGLNMAQAGTIFGVTVIIAGAIGTFLGGQLSDRVFKKKKNPYLITSLIGTLCAFPFALAGVATANLYVCVGAFGIASMFAFMQTGPLGAAVASSTSSRLRSMSFALNIFIIHALGDAASPVIIGRLSDCWGLKTAILVCSFVLLPACIFMWLATKFKGDSSEDLPVTPAAP